MTSRKKMLLLGVFGLVTLVCWCSGQENTIVPDISPLPYVFESDRSVRVHTYKETTAHQFKNQELRACDNANTFTGMLSICLIYNPVLSLYALASTGLAVVHYSAKVIT